MAGSIKIGDCVRLPDGRIGRVRDTLSGKIKIRVRRKTSRTHQFLAMAADDLKRVPCPKGWMSPEGYNRYLKTTLAKMRARQTTKGSKRPGKR